MKTSDLIIEIEKLKKEIEQTEKDINRVESRLLCSSKNCWFEITTNRISSINVPNKLQILFTKQSFEYVENEKFRLKLLNDKLETLLNKDV